MQSTLEAETIAIVMKRKSHRASETYHDPRSMTHGLRSMVSSSAGFTLVEAVIAVAIMSICAFALMAAASKCLALALTSRNLHTAATVMDQAELDYPLLPTNEVSDNVVEPVTYGNNFTFARTVEQLADEKDMFVVETTVSWSMKGKQASESVQTLLYSTNHP